MATDVKIARLPAQARTVFGKKLRALRRQGTIPARISQKRGLDIFVELDDKLFRAAYQKVGSFGLLVISLGDQSLPVMLQNVQRHPITSQFLHVDLLAVDLTQLILAEVNVALAGESPAERAGVGFVLRQTGTLMLRGLPEALPRVLEGQLSSLEAVGDRILAGDLVLPAGVELVSDPDTVLAAVMWQGVAEQPLIDKEEGPTSLGQAPPSQH